MILSKSESISNYSSPSIVADVETQKLCKINDLTPPKRFCGLIFGHFFGSFYPPSPPSSRPTSVNFVKDQRFLIMAHFVHLALLKKGYFLIFCKFSSHIYPLKDDFTAKIG